MCTLFQDTMYVKIYHCYYIVVCCYLTFYIVFFKVFLFQICLLLENKKLIQSTYLFIIHSSVKKCVKIIRTYKYT